MTFFPVLFVATILAVLHYGLSKLLEKPTDQTSGCFSWTSLKSPLLAYIAGFILFFLSPGFASLMASLVQGLFPATESARTEVLAPGVQNILQLSAQSVVFFSVIATSLLYVAAIVLMISGARKYFLNLAATIYIGTFSLFVLGAGVLYLANMYSSAL
ncbi:hypothetical protein COW46_04895 [Candidatus Gracilibacteria bacterium CG17_big_fil_post_rev_8_21_14_2_50_48_13]|nr:MAG: hypothetical protein COW46_04895 [Candidatus Gracilibacteria bacterium CG17_big_fil_post_rev_8_21_14_2_50_48_13]